MNDKNLSESIINLLDEFEKIDKEEIKNDNRKAEESVAGSIFQKVWENVQRERNRRRLQNPSLFLSKTKIKVDEEEVKI